MKNKPLLRIAVLSIVLPILLMSCSARTTAPPTFPPTTSISTSTSIPTPTPTPTSAPTQTAVPSPTPTPTPNILFYDDFSDPSSGWQRESEKNHMRDYSNGGYRISVAGTGTAWYTTNSSLPTYTDTTVEVDVTKMGGTANNIFGIICRFGDDGGYWLIASSSGQHYGIAKAKMEDDQSWSMYWLSIQETQISNAIRQGQATNRVRADCVGDTLVLYVNGQKLAEAQDNEFKSGSIHFLAGSTITDTRGVSGADLLFDDFVIIEPTEPSTYSTTVDSGSVIYEDDFSDPSSGWYEYWGNTRISEYSNGNYRILVKDSPGCWVAKPASWFYYTDIRIEVDITWVDGDDDSAVGILCRKRGEDFYRLQISRSGDAVIWKYKDGEWIPLQRSSNEALKSILSDHTTSHFRADCVGGKLELYINGEKTIEAQDNEFQYGQVGLSVVSYSETGAEVLFDNFKLMNPPVPLTTTREPPTETPCVPSLISPEEGAVLDNGRMDRQDDIIWDFDWSDCPGATQYHLYVCHLGAQSPAIDYDTISNSSYHDVNPGTYISGEEYRNSWSWKVRAKVDGQWGEWSEVRTFDVEPVDSDPPSP